MGPALEIEQMKMKKEKESEENRKKRKRKVQKMKKKQKKQRKPFKQPGIYIGKRALRKMQILYQNKRKNIYRHTFNNHYNLLHNFLLCFLLSTAVLQQQRCGVG